MNVVQLSRPKKVVYKDQGNYEGNVVFLDFLLSQLDKASVRLIVVEKNRV